ncbi:MAG: serine/threonine protein kinase [Candidatus Dormibacteria bacterium]
MSATVRVDELTGAAIGRYRVGGRLQALPYASIHRGTALADERPVLVWTFREPYATAAGFLEALQRLAGDRRAAQIPGLLQVLEIGAQELRNPLVYLVTEDAASGFLVGLLQAGRAPGVFAITGRLARTVDQMHALGMVHGDIQPATVAIAEAGPVLAGHSIRTVVRRVTPAADWVDITRAFRPPEAPTSSEPLMASDLWGLGALVYYLLVGRPPSPDGLLSPPSQFRPQLPVRVDRAVMRALAPDPSERFGSAAEFFAALRRSPVPAAADRSRPEPVATASGGASYRVPSAVRRALPSPGVRRDGEPAIAAPAAAAQPSSRWPLDPPLTPASLRAEALPFRSEGEGDSGSNFRASESTQLIAMEPYRFEPKFRRRGGYLVLWFLVIVVAVAAVLLVTGKVHF